MISVVLKKYLPFASTSLHSVRSTERRFVETKEFGEARTDAAILADIASYDAVGTFDGFYFNQVGGGAAPLAQVAGIAAGLTGSPAPFTERRDSRRHCRAPRIA